MADPYIFAEITGTDRAGVVWVAAILSFLYSLSTLVVRFFVKFHTLGPDDWLVLAATIVAFAQYVAVWVSLHQGLGVSALIQAESTAKDLGAGVMANEILFILAVGLTKISVVLFIKRLLTQELRMAWYATWAALGMTVAWTIASVLLVSVGCIPENAVFQPQQCTGMVRILHPKSFPDFLILTACQTVRWGIVIATDAFLELAYVALAVALVMPLQMKTSIKITVIAAFAFRIPCVVLSALHGKAITTFVQSDDSGLAIANRILWQQVVLGYALVSATIPTLKSFIRGYNKAIGRDYSSRSRRLGGGYGLDSYGRSGTESGMELRSVPAKGMKKGQGDFQDDIKLRPKDGQQYRANAFGDGGVVEEHKRRASNGSNGSQDPIIRRDISINVEYEDVLKK